VDQPTFVFDGDCSFCSACARFIERHIRPGARVVAWQFADLGALGLTEAECETAVQFVPLAAGRPTAGPAAIAALLRTAGPLWRAAGRGLGLRPVTAAAWPVYRWVARNRHRMPGGTPACALPADHPARQGR
jgi:predicted DCC family thiol-disulfide oxidoreductase YuxK